MDGRHYQRSRRASRRQGPRGARFFAVLIAGILLALTFHFGKTYLPLYSGSGDNTGKTDNPFDQPAEPPAGGWSGDNEYRAVWFSYLDLADLLTGKSETDFTNSITNAFDNCKDIGLNTVIVQVRPFSDALYPSEVFPLSKYVTGTQGDTADFDPLAIMIKEAHSRGLNIEAWVNPYRIQSAADSAPAESNPGARWYSDETTKNDYVVSVGTGLYYNPAVQKVQDLIADGIEEILTNYDVDAIHFDDYFYPSGIDESFDSAAYSRYREAGGELALDDFRRDNVNTLVKRIYELCHKYDRAFGVSPQGNVGNCYNTQYCDVKLWCAEDGYVDYIAPQIYWGYEHPQLSAQFNLKVSEWNSYMQGSAVKLYIGLAAYRIGDDESGFTSDGNDMARMIADSRLKQAYGGFIFFRYADLISGAELNTKEMEGVRGLLVNEGA